MSLLDYFRSSRAGSAAIAKERLQILVAHERLDRVPPDYLPDLQRDLLEVVRKYIEIGKDDITVTIEQEENRGILELNIVLPGGETIKDKKLRR